jgi:hypothetical protein
VLVKSYFKETSRELLNRVSVVACLAEADPNLADRALKAPWGNPVSPHLITLSALQSALH